MPAALTVEEARLERAVQVFSDIVHNLRDPLFVVLGCADQLKANGGAARPAPAVSVQVLDRMHKAAERIQSIIAETVPLIRERLQHVPLHLAPFDLREFCQQIVSGHWQCQRLRFECAAGLYPIMADASVLHRAIENVLSNALKYSDHRVHLTLKAAVGGYLLETKDRGIGIPLEDQPTIFTPFFRASNTGNRPGHGLGLSLARNSLEQHGARISFVSRPGTGTTFTIELPAAPPAANRIGPVRAAGTGPFMAKPGSNGGATVLPNAAPNPSPLALAFSPVLPGIRLPLAALIVEDDPLVRTVLRGFLDLSKEANVLGEAGTVAQARTLLRQQTPDVLLLDVGLPDGTGFDLLAEVPARTAVIVVTSSEQHAVQAFEHAAADCLIKPVSFERLQQALSRARERLALTSQTGPASNAKLEETFLVKTVKEMRLVKIGAIIRILAYGEYSWVYPSLGEAALVRKSLKQWLSELPAEQFVRVHRHAIVNLAFMQRVEKLPGGRLQVHLRETAEPILVSLRLSPALNRRLKA